MSHDAGPESPYLINPVPGFTPIVGHLVSMMNYARTSTLDDVDGLTTEKLDHLLDEDANSIGMLLEHIASVEEYYQQGTFGWSIEGERFARWRLSVRTSGTRPADAFVGTTSITTFNA